MIGWDPVFEYEGQTFAEMDKDEKVREIPRRPYQPKLAILTLALLHDTE